MRRLLAPLAAAAIMFASFATAQDYPSQPITFVVPFSAGGPTDAVTRLIADPMGKTLGQSIVVQNVTGAGGTVAAGQVAKAPADGYMVLMHHIGMATAPGLYSNLPYNPLEDFETIGLVTEAPMTFIARKDFPANTLEEMIDYLKANADTVTIAHGGVAGAAHLCGMLLMKQIGKEITTVPYQGTAPALTDLISGQVDIMCDQATNTSGQILGGEVKAYAVTAEERLANLPDVPTTAEAGLGDFQLRIWHGLYVPKDTDPAIIQKLSEALQVAVKDQKVIDRFAELGTTPVSPDRATPEALSEMLSSQLDLWGTIIKESGVSPQ
ncbi:tripartite-type tricarboxylate transporter receptor subunit TctC [Mesorhizobium sp. J18]|uniref:tripartite tricarboxylate transporter substrate-binding protein n=1 Tax=Mesorhizobium sp. J18 TaxID=935263 RepID=UPI00119BB576|nr:tripartite tricarboxylate transporter substrate-binding protein [Mesorhizobium sp. J18]TWG94101.1 tripartite-type tricarboxylate transporter receptor subunit TctC [Mesorhizobium sp. J18]